MMTISKSPRFIAKQIDSNGNARYIREFNPWKVLWTDEIQYAAQQLKWVFTSDFEILHPDIEIEVIPVD